MSERSMVFSSCHKAYQMTTEQLHMEFGIFLHRRVASREHLLFTFMLELRCRRLLSSAQSSKTMADVW